MRSAIDWINRSRVQGILAAIGALATFASLIVALYLAWAANTEPGLKLDGMNELVENSRMQTQATLEMRDASLPADEIEALGSRNYSVDRAGFHKAMRNGDVTSISLFCDAPISHLVDSYFFFDHYPITDAVASMLSDCSVVDIKSVCDLEAGNGQGGSPRFPWKEDIVVNICGQETFEEAKNEYQVAYDAWISRTAIYCRDLNKGFEEDLKKWGRTMVVTSSFSSTKRAVGWKCKEAGEPLRLP